MLDILFGGLAFLGMAFAALILWGWCTSDFSHVETAKSLRSDDTHKVNR